MRLKLRWPTISSYYPLNTKFEMSLWEERLSGHFDMCLTHSIPRFISGVLWTKTNSERRSPLTDRRDCLLLQSTEVTEMANYSECNNPKVEKSFFPLSDSWALSAIKKVGPPSSRLFLAHCNVCTPQKESIEVNKKMSKFDGCWNTYSILIINDINNNG